MQLENVNPNGTQTMSEALKVLRESNGLLPALIENLPGGAVFVVDRDLRYLLAQGEALSYAGFRPEDFVGRTIFEALPPELATEYETLYRQGLAGEPFEHEHSAHDRSFISRGTPLWSPDGEVYAVLAVSYDITDRKRTEAIIAADLRDTQRLQDFSARLVAEADVQVLYDEIMAAAIALMQADAGSLQVLDEATQELVLIAIQGCTPMMAEHFRRVNASSNTPCGVALATGQRTFTDFDVPECEDPDGSLRLHVQVGFLSAQSTPLITRSGKLIGMFSTHWRKHHRPSDRELRFLDLLARQAADLIEQRQVEQSLRESDEKYRSLFNSMDEGVVTLELIFDENERAVDFRYLEHNPALTQQTGLTSDIIGKRVSEIFPDLEAYWLEAYERVVKTSEPERFEYYFATLDSWFDIFIARNGGDGSRTIVAVYNNITDHKRHEANLAFLNEVSQDLAHLTNIEATMNALGAKIGRYLNLGRCIFCEVIEAEDKVIMSYDWHCPELPSAVGEAPISQFVSEEFRQRCRAGTTIVVADLHKSLLVEAWQVEDFFDIAALVCVPFLRDGQWRFALVVHNVAPRDWRDDEIELLREITTRIWTRLERARAEESLRESEEKYRSLFNSIDEGFCIIERVEGEPIDFRYIEANPAFAVQTGISDVVGKTIREAFPDAPEAGYETYENVLKTGEPIRFEIDVPSISRVLEIYAFRIDDEPRLAVIFKDITERKRAEAALRHAAEMDAFRVKLSDALRSLTDPVEIQAVAARLLGEHLSANQVHYGETIGDYVVIQQGYGNGLPPMVGSFRFIDFGERLIADYRAGQTVVSRDVINDPTITEAERRVIAGAGFQAYIAVPLTKAEEWVATLAVHSIASRDWTTHEVELVQETAERTWAAVERARAEESVRAADARLRVMTDAAPVLIWETDKTGTTFVNRYYLDFFGVSFENLREMGWARFMHPDDAAGYEAVWQESVQQRQPYTYDCRFLRTDGQYRWLRNTGQPMGENRMVGCSLDITESKQAEEDRIRLIREQAAREEERQRAEALAELDRAKTLFFSNISHEFRTPLTLLLAPLQDALESVEAWEREGTGDLTLSPSYSPIPSLKKHLQLARRNSLRLMKLVNTLLDFSRIEAGRIEAVYEPTDLAQVTTDLASVFRSAIERAGLRLIVDCPPLSEPVYIDREMWEKIVLNLLSNALKFTFSGEITVSLHPNDRNQVILQIRDTGGGIAPEHLPHLFERFYQVRGVQARTHEGSGIGLALVHELVQLQGGAIAVSSTVGQGTCFTMSLPFGTAHLPSERIQATRTLTSTDLGADLYVEEAERWLLREGNREWGMGNGKNQSSPTPSTARVLIVDDNADMRQYLTRILSERVHVEAVADGTAAMAAIQTQPPDLVLSDVMMPRLDGFGLLQTLRTDPRTREVPVILLSARVGEEAISEGLDAGADDYLIKPFSAQELVSRVNAHLQMSHLRGEALLEARTAMRRKDELLSVVSHELNTPLVSILGWTRLLRSNPSNPAMLSKALDTIERSAMIQAKLVQDLLDVSRITAGKLRLNLQPTELASVIEAAIATVTQIAAEAGIHLTWTETTTAVVMGDRERLQQVVCNLLTNAIKFTPNGGRVDICLSLVTGDLSSIENEALTAHDQEQVNRDNYAEIRVTDTGIGISADFLPHVFEQFRQAEGKNSAKGLGLGLAIARHIVELHNGTIHAHSAGEGQGTTFIVKLPLFEGTP